MDHVPKQLSIELKPHWAKQTAPEDRPVFQEPIRHEDPRPKKLLGDHEFEMIKKLREAQGKNYDEIAEILNAQGFTTKGGAKFVGASAAYYMRANGYRLRKVRSDTKNPKLLALRAKEERHVRREARRIKREARALISQTPEVSYVQPMAQAALPTKTPFLHEVMEILSSNLSEDTKERFLKTAAREWVTNEKP